MRSLPCSVKAATVPPSCGLTRARRLPGCTGCRAESAIDGDLATAWQTPFDDVRNQYVDYDLPAPVTFDHMDLAVVADGRHSVPTRIRLEVDGEVRDLTLPPIADQAGENATRDGSARVRAGDGEPRARHDRRRPRSDHVQLLRTDRRVSCPPGSPSWESRVCTHRCPRPRRGRVPRRPPAHRRRARCRCGSPARPRPPSPANH